jgi:hypothetical protein
MTSFVSGILPVSPINQSSQARRRLDPRMVSLSAPAAGASVFGTSLARSMHANARN